MEVGSVPPSHRHIVGMRVDATSYDDAVQRIGVWAARGESRYVCVSTVHMAMESHDNPDFRHLVNGADLVTPDGVPLVWCLRLMGAENSTRVYGPELTPRTLEHAARTSIPVGFFGGGSPEALRRLTDILGRRFPGLKIAYAHSPPFRPLTPEEDEEVSDQIVRSGAKILFVGLGCPKQERWMAAHRNRIPAVMIGVGAAFDFLAGAKNQAPAWMQRIGMEWLFRLLHEPRRLWKRYLKHNPRFVLLVALQLTGLRRFGA